MSNGEKDDRLKRMLDTGKIDIPTYSRLRNDPVQATQILQNEESMEMLRDLRNGLFGNDLLQIEGALPQLRRLKDDHNTLREEFNSYKYMGIGIAAVVSGLVAIIGLCIDYAKH